MSKPSRGFPRPLSELLQCDFRTMCSKRRASRQPRSFRAGPTSSAPKSPRTANRSRSTGRARSAMRRPEPATLVLRVEGPAALEIQHLSAVILERVNRFFGWQAIGRIALRQAPLQAPRKAAAGRRSIRPWRRAGRRNVAGYKRRQSASGAWPAGRCDQAKLRTPDRLGRSARHCHNCAIQLASEPTDRQFSAQEPQLTNHPPRILPEHGRAGARHRRAGCLSLPSLAADTVPAERTDETRRIAGNGDGRREGAGDHHRVCVDDVPRIARIFRKLHFPNSRSATSTQARCGSFSASFRSTI